MCLKVPSLESQRRESITIKRYQSQRCQGYSGTERDLFLLSEVVCMETVASSREGSRTGQGKEYGFLLTLLNFCNQPTLKLIT